MPSSSTLYLVLYFPLCFALFIWHFITPRMHAQPWRMLMMATMVVTSGAVWQTMQGPQPRIIAGNAEASQFLTTLYRAREAGVTVLLSLGGALFGAAVSTRAAHVHAAELSRIDREMRFKASMKERAKEGFKAEVAPGSDAEELDSADQSERLAHERFLRQQYMQLEREIERLRKKAQALGVEQPRSYEE